MTWQECFDDYSYRPLITRDADGRRRLDLEFFLDDDENVPEALVQAYVSSRDDELFLVFKPSANVDIIEFCDQWDMRIMKFINFDDLHDSEGKGNIIEKLRYNITQVLLHTSSFTQIDHSLEKSVRISRKIFLPYIENDVIFDSDKKIDNRTLLPFWYDQLREAAGLTESSKDIEDLLPADGADTFFLCEYRLQKSGRKRYLSDDQFSVVERWLNK